MHAHNFHPSRYPDYEECQECYSLRRIDPVDLSAIYEGKRYWESDTGHPTVAEQVYNCNIHQENGITKNDFVLQLLPKGMDAVAEVACAPGILLNRLITEGYAKNVIGFEVDPSYEQDIRAIAGVPVDLGFGYFPATSAYIMDGSLDAVICLDVLEHVPSAEIFLRECFRLLNKRGKLILMLPLAEDDGTLLDESALHPEHIALYSRTAMREMMTDAGFNNVVFGQWHSIHQSVIAEKE